MDNRSDIWRRLQDHQISPPGEMFDNLRKNLHLSDEADGTGFQKLQDHHLAPPPFLWSAVKAAALQRRPYNVRRLLSYAAAACLLLILIGVVVDRTFRNPHAESITKVRTPAGDAEKAGTASTPDTASALTGSAVSASGNATDSFAPVSSADQGLPLALTIDGSRFSLVDNNPLTTLISYKYPALKNRINNKRDAGLRIRLDQYTNIALSPAMTGMIRDLYDTRSNGMPSRKARKTKERLEKWKTDDEKQFDGSRFSNPLDPIDLAEFLFPPLFSFGKHTSPTPASLPATAPPSTHSANGDLTVSYALTMLTKRSNTGIGETYSGGIETIFLQRNNERLRLASLMRIQSIVLSGDSGHIILLNESTNKKTKRILTSRQWSANNLQYAGATYDLTPDTTTILGYTCKKALISLNNGRQIIAWYTPAIKNPILALEPAFSGVPGLVLRYEYTCRKKTLRYSATSISRQPIDPSIFAIVSAP
jgi:hypothetical protein